MSREIFELQASICQAMANAKRLEIINLLGKGELPVGVIAEKMDVKMANLSQHLSVMKAKGILAQRREGVHIYYRVANPKVLKACSLMKEVLTELLDAGGELLKRME